MSRALRILLLVVGVVLLLWIPVSFFTAVSAWIPIPACDSALYLHSERGNAVAWLIHDRYGVFSQDEFENEFEISWHRPAMDHRPLAEFDWFRDDVDAYLIFPLWLPAILCLAWPVTSFILARRKRHSRGFEVQAKADSAVSTADS